MLIIQRIENLYNDNYYNEFIMQPKLLPYAEEYVVDRFAILKAKFAELLA